MSKARESTFYVVYAEPQIEVEHGKTTLIYQIPASNRFHKDIQSAKKEYDELSVKSGKLLGLVESISFIERGTVNDEFHDFPRRASC